MKPRSILICAILGVCLGAAQAQPSPTYDALIQQGKAQLQSGNSAQALASGQQAIQLDANRWEAYALAGGALMNLKRYDEAIDNLGKSIGHAPADKQAGLRDLIKQCALAESGANSPPAQPAAPPPQPATTTQAEIVLWKTIENSQNSDDFNGYLTQYPDGAFVILAKNHLSDLEAARQAQLQQQQRLVEQSDQDAKEGVWTDPATHLMWEKDGGKAVGSKNAPDYCSNLRLAVHNDWRLPTLDELQGVYDPDVSRSIERSVHMKGGLNTGFFYVWGTNDWYFDFRRGLRTEYARARPDKVLAICVRNGSG
jgi:tetratricopeptide (TPR) repeat protein